MENNGQSDIFAFCCVFCSLWQINSTASWPTVPPPLWTMFKKTARLVKRYIPYSSKIITNVRIQPKIENYCHEAEKRSKWLRQSEHIGHKNLMTNICYLISLACLTIFGLKATYTNVKYSSRTCETLQLIFLQIGKFLHYWSDQNAPVILI